MARGVADRKAIRITTSPTPANRAVKTEAIIAISSMLAPIKISVNFSVSGIWKRRKSMWIIDPKQPSWGVC